jgi:hypothetical protein
MNKIYKVIWSKARNCYVAVSELAGSHDTSSVRKQQVIAAVVAALLVGMPFSGNVFADTATGTVDNKGQVVVNVTPKTTEVKVDGVAVVHDVDGAKSLHSTDATVNDE